MSLISFFSVRLIVEDSVIRGPDILHTCIFYSIKFDKNASVVKTVCTMLNMH